MSEFYIAQIVIMGTLMVALLVRVYRSKKRERLESARRNDTLAAVASDLKASVETSRRNLELLMEGSLGKLQALEQELIQKMLDGNIQQSECLETIVQLCRYDSPHPQVVLEKIDVRRLVNECMDEMSIKGQTLDINLNVNLPEKAVYLMGDADALKLLFENLLENAMTFSPAGSNVATLVRSDGQVTISVIDSGAGISEQEQKDLFKPVFHREQSQDVRARVGLGLYLCARIASSHGGKINCVSRPGAGSTFTVTLPLAR